MDLDTIRQKLLTRVVLKEPHPILKDEMRVEYGPSIRKLKWDFIPSSMCMSLMLVEAYYEKLLNLLPKFTQLCEENLKKKT